MNLPASGIFHLKWKVIDVLVYLDPGALKNILRQGGQVREKVSFIKHVNMLTRWVGIRVTGGRGLGLLPCDAQKGRMLPGSELGLATCRAEPSALCSLQPLETVFMK